MMNMMISPPQPPPEDERDDRHYDDATVTAPIVESTNAVQLAKLYDVSMVDSYLLQTYIVPHVIDALNQLLLPLLSFYRTQQKFRHQQHHGDSTCSDASVTDANIIPDSLLPRLVRCAVPVFTLLWTGGMTPAMRQMNLQFQSTNRLVETKTGDFQRKLLCYAIVQHIIPELLYPLLRYYIQSKMNHVATTTLSGNTMSDERNRSTHPPPNLPNDPTLIKKRRQYLMLQWLQSILQHVDTKVIPIVQLLLLLRWWSGTSTASLPMILAGLTYINTTPTAMILGPTESPTSVFFNLDLAHRRWFTHHIWETIGTVLLPSIRANMVSSPHALVSHLQRVVQRFRTLVQGTVAAMVRPPSPSSSTTLSEITSQQKDISAQPQQQNDNTTTCPLCQQVPPTMSVRVSCPNCRNHHQMYCYACFYQYYGMNDRQRHPGDDFDEDQVDDDDDDHLACAEGGSSSSSRSSCRRRHTTTAVGTPPHVATRVSYRIPTRSIDLQCRVCHTAVDTVSFGHPTQ